MSEALPEVEVPVEVPIDAEAPVEAPIQAPPTAAGAARAQQRRPARPTGATGRGVIVLILGATFLAGLLDMALSGHRGHLFGVVFAAASAAGALFVRRRDLPTAMIAPPLLYCLLIAVMGLIDQGGLSGGFASRTAFYIGTAFVTGAPAIWCGAALAAGIGWYRLRRGL